MGRHRYQASPGGTGQRFWWLLAGLRMLDKLELSSFVEQALFPCREDIEWGILSLALILWRLYEPSGELYMVEHLYDKSPLGDLLGMPPDLKNRTLKISGHEVQ